MAQAAKIERLSAPAATSMGEQWYELATPDHFWMRWRLGALLAALKRTDAKGPYLEVGCGSGAFRAQAEAALGEAVDGCDLLEPAVARAAPGRGRLMIYDVTERRPELGGRYGVVFLMDVLEHLEDDRAFLAATAFHARPGGLVAINVPALQGLFSRYDTAAGHLRRYGAQSLRALVESAGLELVEMRFWGGSLLPIALLRKAVLRFVAQERVIDAGFRPPSRLVNAMFCALMKAELALTARPMRGTSLIALARKP